MSPTQSSVHSRVPFQWTKKTCQETDHRQPYCPSSNPENPHSDNCQQTPMRDQEAQRWHCNHSPPPNLALADPISLDTWRRPNTRIPVQTTHPKLFVCPGYRELRDSSELTAIVRRKRALTVPNSAGSRVNFDRFFDQVSESGRKCKVRDCPDSRVHPRFHARTV